METTNFLPLAAAMQQLQATDEKEFVKSAKKHGCYFMKGGIVRIDVTKLNLALDAEFAQAQVNAANRKTRDNSPGRDLGLIEARLTLYPGRIKAKNEKIKSVEATLTEAGSAYVKRKLRQELKTLEGQLAKMEASYQRDLKRRDEILNSDDGDSESSAEQE